MGTSFVRPQLPGDQELAPLRAAVGYGHLRRLSNRMLLLIAVISVWSFTSDLVSLVSEAHDTSRGLVLDIVSLGALTFGVLVSGVRASLGTTVTLAGALLYISEEPPLLAIVVLVINALVVAYTAGRSFARLQIALSAGWFILHLVLVPGSQWLIWGFVPCLLGLHILGTHLAGLREDNVFLQERVRRDRESKRLAVETERRNIARDLHDIVAHDMTLVAMQADAARISADPERVRMFLDAISDASHQSLHDLRVMMKVLVPPSGDAPQRDATPVSNQSLKREVEDAARRLTDLGFDVDMETESDIDGLYRVTQVALAPIIRECTTNIVKHTKPDGLRFASISFTTAGGPLVIRISSGPVGATALDVPSGSFGLLCLAERMHLVGGTFWSGRLDDRWVVKVSLPQGAVGATLP